MKKLVIALTALAAFTGSAAAADLGARPYVKAPAPVLPGPELDRFLRFRPGAGGGVWGGWGVDSHTNFVGVPAQRSISAVGGDGWFGTVGIGYDWQFGR